MYDGFVRLLPFVVLAAGWRGIVDLRKPGLCLLAGMVLLAGLTLYTRGAAPWQDALTNDEMLHLESWRNRYRTDDIYPVFIKKVNLHGLLDGRKLELLESAYESSTLVQRGLLVLNDLHPPTFPVLAEVVEAVTHSSLVAVRMVSAIASALAVLFMYLLGRDLRSRSLGLWLATLLGIGFLAQVHAGIARPLALTQFALVLALYAFVRDQMAPGRSPWRFLLASLFVQSTDWSVWVIMFPLVAVVAIGCWRRAGIGGLVRQTWWYAALTVLMLPLLAVHLSKGVIETFMGDRPLTSILYCYALASPFASLDWVLSIEPRSVLSPAALLLFFLTVAGTACLVADVEYFRTRPGSGFAVPGVRVGFLLALIASVGMAVFGIPGHIEAILIFVAVPTVIAGTGLHWMLRSERASQIAAVAVLAVFSVIRIGWPEDPYARVLLDTDYAAVAQRLRAELGPDDLWTAFGRHRADCLYRYGPFPEPVEHLTKAEFYEFLATLPRPGSAVIVFARMDVIVDHVILRTAPEQWEFVNGFRVVKIPPKESARVGGHLAVLGRDPGGSGSESSRPRFAPTREWHSQPRLLRHRFR